MFDEKVYTAVIAQLEENTEQVRTNTKAVLNLLDRLNGSDGLAAASRPAATRTRCRV
jgi:hypothetical protein